MRARAVTITVVLSVVGAACSHGGAQVKSVKSTSPRNSTTTTWPANTEGPGCNFNGTPVPSNGGKWAVIADVFVTAPVFSNGLVYAGANSANTAGGCVFALDPATGELKWQLQTPITPGAKPIPSGNIIAASVMEQGLGAALLGLDGTTGERRWRVPLTGTLVTAPQLLGGLVYVLSDRTRTIQPATGRSKWSINRKALAVASGPAGTFITFEDNDTTAQIDPNTGRLGWSTPLGPRSAVVKAVSATVVVLENAPNDIYALDGKTGRQLWFQNMPGAQNSAITVDGDEIYVSTDDGKAYRLEARTGRITWSSAIGLTVGAAPLVAGDEVVFASSSPTPAMVGLNRASGQQRWRLRTNSPVTSELLRGGNDLYAGTHKGLLCKVDLTGVQHTCVEVVGEAVGALNRTLANGNNLTFVRIGNQTIAAA